MNTGKGLVAQNSSAERWKIIKEESQEEYIK